MELVPTEFAIRMRPWFIGSLGAIVVLIILKFIIHDLWGAVSLVFVVLMGLFVLLGQYPVSASNAFFYCVMALISGIFDVISCILYFQHCAYDMFDKKAPKDVLLTQVLFLLSPIVLFASAMLAYSIFCDCRDNAQDSMPIRGAPWAYTVFGDEVNYQAVVQPRPQRPPQPPTQPFSGHSQRLDTG